MKFTIQNLKDLCPCDDGLKWYLANIKSEDIREVLLQVNEHKDEWARWLMVRVLTKEENQKTAIFSAESVIHIFEEQYPDNKFVRDCIQATKDYLAGKIDKGTLFKYRYAAYTYATYAAFAADAAPHAAYYAAAYSAAAASFAASADAAFAAASSAAGSADDEKAIQEKIINYACDLMEAR